MITAGEKAKLEGGGDGGAAAGGSVGAGRPLAGGPKRWLPVTAWM